MPRYSRAFISYHSSEREIAARVAAEVQRLGMAPFMAHEHIEVSVEWRTRLLQELKEADTFVALLSERYQSSVWCMQESGIAAFRSDLLVIPLSLDHTVSPGFLGLFQSVRIDPARIDVVQIAPAITARDVDKGLGNLLELLSSSRSYRSAEQNFGFLMPHLQTLGPARAVELLNICAANDQIEHAGLCARDYIPALLRAYPRLGCRGVRQRLKETCSRYGAHF